MLYALHKGQVESFQGDQRTLLHFVATAEAVQVAGLQFAFTDGHAAMAITQFFDDLNALARVDWEVVNSSSWGDTPNDPDRSRRKQAEFLVHRFCPWSMVEEIGVIDTGAKHRVEEILLSSNHRPRVVVRRAWYY